jgi:ribosomal protein S18 acetylase RimI-like enzyme
MFYPENVRVPEVLQQESCVMEQDHSLFSAEAVRCEHVTDAVIASYAEKGYQLMFAEEVMRYDLSQTLPRVVVPFEVGYLCWTPERARDFFAVYEAAFRERPGFPGWRRAEWVAWTSDDPTFRPDLSILAMVQGQAVGFITSSDDEEAPERYGYLIQVGVHPAWRSQRLGAALTTHALQMWREAGREAVILHVNVNNPGAIQLYRQLGFRVVGRRGKFARRMVL